MPTSVCLAPFHPQNKTVGLPPRNSRARSQKQGNLSPIKARKRAFAGIRCSNFCDGDIGDLASSSCRIFFFFGFAKSGPSPSDTHRARAPPAICHNISFILLVGGLVMLLVNGLVDVALRSQPLHRLAHIRFRVRPKSARHHRRGNAWPPKRREKGRKGRWWGEIQLVPGSVGPKHTEYVPSSVWKPAIMLSTAR